MDYEKLIKILIEWSIQNKEYNMSLFLFDNYNLGIPNKLLYRLPKLNYFQSFSSLNSYNDIYKSDDLILDILILKLKKSKYKYLEKWKCYGYIKN